VEGNHAGFTGNTATSSAVAIENPSFENKEPEALEYEQGPKLQGQG